MDAEESVTEFVNVLRLGTEALRRILSYEPDLAIDFEADFNQLLHLLDSIEDIGDNIKSKTRNRWRGHSSM